MQRSRWAEVLYGARCCRLRPSFFLFQLSETTSIRSLALYFACSQRVTFRYEMKRKGSDIRSFFSGPVDKRTRVGEPSKGPSRPLSSGNVPVQFENVVRME